VEEEEKRGGGEGKEGEEGLLNNRPTGSKHL
jgi:hypothetical protein